MIINNESYQIIFDEDAKIESNKSDCDCACVSAPSAENIQLNRLERNNDLILKQREDLVFQLVNEEYTFVLSPKSPKSRAILNSAAINLLEYFSTENSVSQAVDKFHDFSIESTWNTLETLENLAFIEPFCKENSQPVNFSNKVSGRVLNAWIHITNACNLRCSYCFLDKTSQKMSLETGLKSIDAVIRSASNNGFDGVKIKYAGGEPTLNVDLIAQLDRHASCLADEQNIEYSAVILSNGTLINEKFMSIIKERNINLMISLDGVGEFHDKQRAFVNGKGSFNIIDRNISRLIAREIKPFITVTVSSQSAPGLPAMVSYLLDKDLPFTLNFYRSNIYSQPYDEQLQLDEEIIIRYMKKAYQLIETKMPRQSLLGSLLDLNNASAPHNKTCGVGENYLVIDQIGGVSKCHMDIENPLTTINNLDPLIVINSDTKGIQNLPVNQKHACNSCEWRYWCAGGCPLVTYKAYGKYDVKSPNCRIYKSLYPEVLRLEGLRLLGCLDAN